MQWCKHMQLAASRAVAKKKVQAQQLIWWSPSPNQDTQAGTGVRTTIPMETQYKAQFFPQPSVASSSLQKPTATWTRLILHEGDRDIPALPGQLSWNLEVPAADTAMEHGRRGGLLLVRLEQRMPSEIITSDFVDHPEDNWPIGG